MSAAALEEIEAILESGGDADDILRAVVWALVEKGGCAWAGILFAEGGELMLGPEAGTQAPDARIQVPVVYQGTTVADLAADGCDDETSLQRIATLIASFCLVGWDTGGVPWDAA